MATKDVFILPDGTELEKGVPFTLKKWENNTWKPVAKYPANFLQNLTTKELQDLGVTKRTETITAEQPASIPLLKQALYHLSRTNRIRYENSTVNILDRNINLDVTNKQIFLLAYIRAKENPNYELKNFRIRELNWITLSANEIIQIVNEMESHMDACALAEKTVNEKILAGEITTKDEILNPVHWPNVEILAGTENY